MSSLPRRPAANPHSTRPPGCAYAAFLIESDVDPQMLPRVLEPFARIGITPDEVLSRVEGEASPVLRIEIRIAGADQGAVHKLSHMLEAIVGVRRVSVSTSPALRVAA